MEFLWKSYGDPMEILWTNTGAPGLQVACDRLSRRSMVALVTVHFGWLFAPRSGLVFWFLKARPLCNWN